MGDRPIVLVGSKLHASLGFEQLVVSAIEYLPIRLDTDPIKALIFTSKHAPLALEHQFKNTPTESTLKSLPVFALASKSAQVARDLGFNVYFVGQKGEGLGFATEIIPLLRALLPPKSYALYVRAQTIVSNLDQALIQAQIPLKQCIAYQVKPLKLPPERKPKPRSILIFGAPSAYRAFRANFDWDRSYTAIALGESTLKSFDPQMSAFKSPKPTLESSIALAKTLWAYARM